MRLGKSEGGGEVRTVEGGKGERIGVRWGGG